eukprot:TRINITY_DN4628_c0_g1_i1.p1 TRINITY_DN4628_c0_g1~~TRINITY_DN4628_c0_g1_i1.p1  ORF type:complete len:423 (-),score=85.71 TRINITY_DN4628_c0_g1_i1:274-1542(-)
MSALREVKSADEILPEDDFLRPFLNTIIQKCPTDFYNSTISSGTSSLDKEFSYPELVRLHAAVKNNLKNFLKSKCLYENLMKKAVELEDILSSRNNSTMRINWSFKKPRNHQLAKIFNILEWIWYTYLYEISLKILCLFSVLLSLSVVWTEMTFLSTSPNLSLFSIILGFQRQTNSIWAQFAIIVPVCYIASSAYYSLFQLKIFNMYTLIPHHMTDPYSLLFNAGYISKLIAPLVYNFLLMLHFHSSKNHQTAFLQVMGDMTIVPFFGEEFFLYFPIVLIIISLSNLFNFHNKAMHFFTCSGALQRCVVWIRRKCEGRGAEGDVENATRERDSSRLGWLKKIEEVLDFRDFEFDEEFMDDRIDQGRELLSKEKELVMSRWLHDEDAPPSFSRLEPMKEHTITKEGRQFPNLHKNLWEEESCG